MKKARTDIGESHKEITKYTKVLWKSRNTGDAQMVEHEQSTNTIFVVQIVDTPWHVGAAACKAA